jgi:cytochrome c peroxidase
METEPSGAYRIRTCKVLDDACTQKAHKESTMQNRTVAIGLAGLWIVGAVLVAAHGKAQVSYSGAPRAASTENLNGQMPADFNREVARMVADLDRIEADTLHQINHSTLDRQGQVRALGKLLLFDKHLSVN